MSGNHLKPI